jgi:hypothetical protein
MFKKILNLIIFFFIIFFFFLVINEYLSDKNKKLINKNRLDIEKIINKNITNLPRLQNDTNNVIEFNNGYNDTDNKIKRNFWDLLKKND